MTVDTTYFRDESLRKAVDRAQRNDNGISFSESIRLIRSCLDAGQLNTHERRGLQTVLKHANFPGIDGYRGFQLLKFFLEETGRGVASTRALKIDEYAGRLTCSFLARTGSSAFIHLDRMRVGVGILTRLACPGLIHQRGTPLCGPSSVMFNMARDRPVVFARYAIDLFEKGRGTLGKIVVKPGTDLKNYSPPKGKIAQVDWITTASLRDSENITYDYDVYSSGISGMTNPGTMEDWLKRVGYQEVKNEANVFWIKDKANLREANRLYKKGWRVCMLINGDMLRAEDQTDKSVVPTHWVVLTSPVSISEKSVRATVFSWGKGKMQIPQGNPLSLDDFLDNYYGYVAARF